MSKPSQPATLVTYRITPRRAVAVPRLRIALFTDLHACTRVMEGPRIDALVDQTNALGADMILLLGDYSGHLFGCKPLEPADVAARLARLTAPSGVFAVFGNHDWRDDPGAIATLSPTVWHSAFDAAGIATLNNATTALTHDGIPFTLAGLDSQRVAKPFWGKEWTGADDLPAVAAALDPERFTLLMAHEPDIFPELPGHVDLTVCGHTHGGQIAPFGKPLVVPSRFGTRYAYGRFVSGTRQMVVSGGLGYTDIPVRIGRPPEITLLDIAGSAVGAAEAQT
ncbi:metallophosphoesterase [Cognatishimia sp. F0-27]|uniref:metallophosphoesterase n=1 Tax=Cognatishimia sp. F0-27 TaxID=2816855 RepID=UPI001D0C3E46|nr:metallophosphoesterase [Cognatishimia sp. F0-27]MCC1493287.1 metallophosphoesterase [Cognatishimia sp. F0-27]